MPNRYCDDYICQDCGMNPSLEDGKWSCQCCSISDSDDKEEIPLPWIEIPVDNLFSDEDPVNDEGL